MGSDLTHAVGEGRLGCEASGPPRGATWVTQTRTRFFLASFGKYVLVLNGYWLCFSRFWFAKRLRRRSSFCYPMRCHLEV